MCAYLCAVTTRLRSLNCDLSAVSVRRTKAREQIGVVVATQQLIIGRKKCAECLICERRATRNDSTTLRQLYKLTLSLARASTSTWRDANRFFFGRVAGARRARDKRSLGRFGFALATRPPPQPKGCVLLGRLQKDAHPYGRSPRPPPPTRRGRPCSDEASRR